MKRVLAISLLIIFISGQINLTWASHFCGNFKVESTLSLGKADLSCGMEEMSCCDEASVNNTGSIIITDRCCSNDYFTSDADDFFDNSGNSFDRQILFINSFVTSLYNYVQQNDEPQIVFVSSPPLILLDHQVLYQTFLL